MLKTQLFGYQKEGVRRLRDLDGVALLADEQGLGKTLQSLYYAWRYLPDDEPGPIVVVVPAHLKTVWARQAREHLGIRVEVLGHEKVPADKLDPPHPNQVYVINYDVLTPDGWRPGTAPHPRSWIRWLAAQKPRLLIADEGHYASNPDSQRARGLRWLARRTPRRLVLTGTPMANKPGDLWSLLNILWPEEFSSRFEFGMRYAQPKKERGRWTYPGAKNLGELHALLKRQGMIRRRKADVLSDLPAILYELTPLDCDLRDYRRAEEDLIAWLAAQDPLAAESAKRAAELAKLSALVQLAGEAKLQHVVRWIKDFLANSEGKLLVGAIHYRMTGAIMDALGKEAVLVDGRKTAKVKDAAFDRFNKDPNCRVLVGNVHAAGTGWSCTSASDVAFAELPWKPSDVAQFASRIHGVGRGQKGVGARVHFLVAAGTIEEAQCRSIQRKAGWAATAIDGDPATADLNLADMLTSVEDEVLAYLRAK